MRSGPVGAHSDSDDELAEEGRRRSKKEEKGRRRSHTFH